MSTITLTAPSRLSKRDAAVYSLSPDVVQVPVEDGTLRLLDMGGDFHAVCAIGAEMLRETLQHGVPAAVERIAGRYAADAEQVRHDLDEFLRDLVRRGLVQRRRRPHRSNSLLAAAVMRPVLWIVDHVPCRETTRAAWMLTLAWLFYRLFGCAKTIAVWKTSLPVALGGMRRGRNWVVPRRFLP